ncbi:MAG: bifunctional UDP-N-acetylglucosamine diphosphorylase/glucosamine-1-phosphate N-acetyltransferase GlmU [Candidatus Adiutrix sp.]
MSTQKPAVLILGAGKGTRMKSETPKVLHHLMGRPLIEYVINAARYLDPDRLVLVTGFGAEDVEKDVAAFMAEPGRHHQPLNPTFVRQVEQLGTGHAVSTAQEVLADFDGPLIIMAGDVPLISPNTLDGFLKAHLTLEADLSVLTVTLDDPSVYGRIIRNEARWLSRIVEFKDASDDERQIKEINSGLYVVDAQKLFASISRLKPNNAQKEYYLTDVVADFSSQGFLAAAIEIPCAFAYEVMGINDRYELAEAQAILKDRTNESWMKGGVSMVDPLSTFIEPTVRLAPDVTLWPGVILTGKTTIEAGAEIGPFCRLKNCHVGAKAKIKAHQDMADLTVAPGQIFPAPTQKRLKKTTN